METYNPIRVTLSLLMLQLFILTSATQEDLIVVTANGKVQGTRVAIPGGGSVLAFLGIPYGKPPVGKLRFRAPEPVEGWAGVREATTFPNTCAHLKDTAFPGFEGAEMWNPNTQISEDCLYLNVWTPRQHNSTSLASVMVWIYGGAFTSGTSTLDLYDGRFLSQSEDVVVVSMNYRLGALGFLTLPEPSSFHGNNGLLDQRLALHWTANNIAAFGGDPSKVTIFGESAGSASVGLHLLSPGSHPLFHRAILMSASPNAQWVTITQAEAWRRTLSLGKLLDCPLSPQADLEMCLQRAKVEDIFLKQFDVLPPSAIFPSIPFAPVVDGDFLPDRPEVLLQTGNFLKTDILIGVTEDEGTYFLLYGCPGYDNTTQSLISRENFLKGVELSLPTYSTITRETAILHYTDWTDLRNETKNRDSLGRILGDSCFCCPVVQFANTYTEHGGKTHLYLFDHRSSVNPWPEWMGVMHGYEIEFVFGQPLNSALGYTEEEVSMSRDFMRRWANFAKTGNPSIKEGDWPLFTSDRQEYVTLNPAPPVTGRNLLAQRCQLWRHLVPKLERNSDDLQTCLNVVAAVQCGTSTAVLMLFLLSITLGLVQ